MVALKVIQSDLLGPEVERRFRAECHTVGELSWHPNVVALHDAGVTPSGSPFLAMELVAGGSFGDRMRSAGPLNPSEALTIGLQVADALGTAHDAGILHRDIKPDNILIGRRGEALLTDFGIATLADGTRSATGSFTGTLAYSAPELLRGERASSSSEVFALSTTVYSLLAGTHAFASVDSPTPAAIMFHVLNEEPAPLPTPIPAALHQVLRRGMEKAPENRYPDMAALHDALAAASPAGGAGAAIRPFSAPTLDHRSSPTIAIVPASEQPSPGAAGAVVDAGHSEPARLRRRWWTLIPAAAAIIGVAVGFAVLTDDDNPSTRAAATTTGSVTTDSTQPEAAPTTGQPAPTTGIEAERISPDIVLFESAIDALTPFTNDLGQYLGEGDITEPENEAGLMGAWYSLADWCVDNGHGRTGVCYDKAATFLTDYFDRDPRTINTETWGAPGAIGGVISGSYDLTSSYLQVESSVLIPDLFSETRPGQSILCEPSCTAVLDGG